MPKEKTYEAVIQQDDRTGEFLLLKTDEDGTVRGQETFDRVADARAAAADVEGDVRDDCQDIPDEEDETVADVVDVDGFAVPDGGNE